MTTPLQLTVRRRDNGTPVLAVAGEIDFSNVETFREAIARAAGDDELLVIDLTGVHYLDSAALAALFAHVRHIELIVPSLLRPVLTISGLDVLTTVHVA